jgi:hypothetical protein
VAYCGGGRRWRPGPDIVRLGKWVRGWRSVEGRGSSFQLPELQCALSRRQSRSRIQYRRLSVNLSGMWSAAPFPRRKIRLQISSFARAYASRSENASRLTAAPPVVPGPLSRHRWQRANNQTRTYRGNRKPDDARSRRRTGCFSASPGCSHNSTFSHRWQS